MPGGCDARKEGRIIAVGLFTELSVRVTKLLLLCLIPIVAEAQVPAVAVPERLAAAALMPRIEDRLWAGWSAAPTQLLLIGDSTESYFPTLGAEAPAWTRKRNLPRQMQATFPAVGGVPTIVIGTPAGTGTPGERWVLTVMHEHFHQFQYSRPDYYTRLAALDLAHGDSTGMWALNFPFPYDSAPVQRAVKRWADALHRALSARKRQVGALADSAFRAHLALDSLLAPDDRRYFDFQLWQEGVPRWIELAAAREGHRAGLIADSSLAWQEQRLLDDLTRIDLGRDRRVVVYALGAAVAELMEREGGDWKRGYFQRMFELEPSPEELTR